MVYIVTGGINSGKTAKLMSLYGELKCGDGFILPKIFIGGKYAGQRIVRLSTGASIPFSYKKEYIPDNWNKKYCYDVYSFSQEGFDLAFDTIYDIFGKHIYPAFMDEIGPLELEGKGFCKLLLQLLDKECTTYISVRESILLNIIDKFKIKSYEIIKV